MENKDSLLIRKYMNLMESIEKKLISEDESLSEDLIASAAREGKLAAAELEGYLKIMTKDPKIAGELTKAGIRTSEELLTALKGNRLTSSLKGSLELSVLRSNTKNPKLIDLASENLVRNKMFDQKYAAEFAKGQPAYEKALKQAGYSDDAITKIVQKKFNQIDPKTGKPYARPETINKQGISATNTPKPKPNVPPAPANTKNLWQKWGDKIKEQLKKKRSWKELVAWAAGIGLGSAALWYAIDSFAGGEKPADTPVTPPVDDSAWAPCVQDFVKNKQGQIVTSQSGEVSVLVQPSEYPEGLKFYTNGRVMNVKTSEMGSWSCKNAQAEVKESQNLSLHEQGSEVDISTLGGYVDTAVDDLDGFVDTSNLNSLVSILRALKGKTFQGKDAITEFLSLYSEDEGGDSFIDDVKSVGVKTLGTNAILLKREVLNLAQGGGGSTPTPAPSGGASVGNINITWDKKEGGETTPPVPNPKKESKWKKCDSFPMNMYCISDMIKEVQKCLCIKEDGKFGNDTKTALGSSTLTKELYDQVKANCKPCSGSNDPVEPKKRPTIEPVGPIKPDIKIPNIKVPEVKINPNIKIPTAPEIPDSQFYNTLKNAGYIKGYDEPTTTVDGEVIPASRRIKYKGPDLNPEQVAKIDRVMTGLNYGRIKQKKDKDYGDKYVWLKEQ